MENRENNIVRMFTIFTHHVFLELTDQEEWDIKTFSTWTEKLHTNWVKAVCLWICFRDGLLWTQLVDRGAAPSQQLERGGWPILSRYGNLPFTPIESMHSSPPPSVFSMLMALLRTKHLPHYFSARSLLHKCHGLCLVVPTCVLPHVKWL